MKYLFSRYGGHPVIIGKGKASNENLPEDQSLDNMLENHSTEIIKNLFYISSYDMVPEYMGAYKYLEKGAVKLGDINHRFNELFCQYDVDVVTSVYVSLHGFSNVFAVFIKTSKDDLKWVVENYEDTYDYVLTVFFRNENLDGGLKSNPKLIEKILTILFYKMGLSDGFHNFEPSKTYLGKKISEEFKNSIVEKTSNISNDDEMAEYLNSKIIK